MFVVFLRIVTTLFAATLLWQPISAGTFVSGQPGMMTWHAVGAALAMFLTLPMMLAGLLLLVGGGTRWPLAASALLLVLVIAQMAAGSTRVLAVHLPLGTALFGAGMAFAWWSWTKRAGQRRRSGRAATAVAR
ncbi:hypothetical protein Athai_64070 [Actinocatenispora thailandica]|uniref:Uncharacterized protein n=1 Tax=Actinocatenispora thailandica TaxID=227318 RepID=A0A7R7DW92_9ACTN|nr:hypothetical protein [Actinocatenispora thailandica]BCJ38904.1 hypothetical protein Athai_64070 [Actinocatenispora thailandica]